jgi:hypothetical protein
MTSFATVNDVPVLSGSIVLPRSGAWSASLTLDTDSAPSGSVTLATDEGETVYRGTVVRAAEVFGRVEVLLVGGAGGLATTLAPKRYLGVTVRLAWQAILTDAGETGSTASDEAILGRQLVGWTRLRETAGTCLQQLAAHVGAVWRIGLDGTVRLSTAGATETVKRSGDLLLDSCPADASALYALAALDLEPGQTLDGRRVSRLAHDIRAGSIRSKVWFDG